MESRRSRCPVDERSWLSPRSQRLVGAGVITGSGILLSLVAIVHVSRTPVLAETLVNAVLSSGLAVVLSLAGVWLWRSSTADADVLRIAGWVVIGMGGLGTLFLWTLAHQSLHGGTFPNAHFVLVTNLVVGGVVGIAIGLYDVQGQRYRRQLESERENLSDERTKLAFLNRMLRHYVLNGVNVITGHATMLADHVDRDGREHLAVIRDQSDEVADVVGKFQCLTRALVGDAEPVPCDLSAILGRRVARMRRTHEHVAITADIPDGVTVVADDMLDQVFENLLTNAIVHNDSATPEVDVTVRERDETVRVRIADDGPGIPAEQRETILEWETKREESEGAGIGLAIVDTLIERYDGTVSFEDNEPTGTVVVVELPTVSGLETDTDRTVATDAASSGDSNGDLDPGMEADGERIAAEQRDGTLAMQ